MQISFQGDDFVTSCFKDASGAPRAVQSKNNGKSNSKTESQEAKLVDFTAADGSLYCKFQQSINKGANGKADLSVPVHLLMALGGKQGDRKEFVILFKIIFCF